MTINQLPGYDRWRHELVPVCVKNGFSIIDMRLEHEYVEDNEYIHAFLSDKCIGLYSSRLDVGFVSSSL